MAVALPVAAEPRLSSSGGGTSISDTYDRSEAYDFGFTPKNPTTVTFDQPEEKVKDITLSANADKLLGCDAIDSGKLVIDSLNNSQYVDEVVGQYPNTELFRRMAQLMLQSPSLVGAIQATLTAGNNRAKLMADRCRTAETMADARTVRIREEARRLCLNEKSGPERLTCLSDQDNTTLKQFITRITGESRWKDDFHTVICQTTRADASSSVSPSGSGVSGSAEKTCFWTAMLPNAKFDPVSGESKVNQPVVSADRLFEALEASTTELLTERVNMVGPLLAEHGFTKVMQSITARQDLNDPSGYSFSGLAEYIVKIDPISNCGSGGTSTLYSSSGPGVTRTESVVARDDFIGLVNGAQAQNKAMLNTGGLSAQFGSLGGSSGGAASAVPQLDPARALDELKRVMMGNGSYDKGAVGCIAAREIHGHVDLKLARLDAGERGAAIRSLSQGIAAKAMLGLTNAIAVKLEDIASQRANLENSNSVASLSPDMANYLRGQIAVMRGRYEQLQNITTSYGDTGRRVQFVNVAFERKIKDSNKNVSNVLATAPASAQGDETQVRQDALTENNDLSR